MSSVVQKIKRTFIPGDEWVYYKLYCGPKTADEILRCVVTPLTTELLDKSLINKWFFIRYSDPQLHLRIRFHLSNPEQIQHIVLLFNKFTRPYIENKLLWKVQIDTYEREIERYGEETIELAEELFFYDSQMILNVVKKLEGVEGDNIRWVLSLKAIDCLLEDFSYDLSQKFNLLERLKEGFGREFGMHKMLKLQLDKKFRNERQKINNVLNNQLEKPPGLQVFLDIINNKSINVKQTAESIKKYVEGDTIGKSLDDLMSSYIHMLMNRFFRSKQRVHEMVIYDFLYRYYKSEIAINKSKAKSKP